MKAVDIPSVIFPLKRIKQLLLFTFLPQYQGQFKGISLPIGNGGRSLALPTRYTAERPPRSQLLRTPVSQEQANLHLVLLLKQDQLPKLGVTFTKMITLNYFHLSGSKRITFCLEENLIQGDFKSSGKCMLWKTYA